MRILNLFQNIGRSAVYKMITEQGNGFLHGMESCMNPILSGPASGHMRKRSGS